jgi:hypothetical protein
VKELGQEVQKTTFLFSIGKNVGSHPLLREPKINNISKIYCKSQEISKVKKEACKPPVNTEVPPG